MFKKYLNSFASNSRKNRINSFLNVPGVSIIIVCTALFLSQSHPSHYLFSNTLKAGVTIVENTSLSRPGKKVPGRNEKLSQEQCNNNKLQQYSILQIHLMKNNF